jgi:hypothetical protein
MNFTNYDLKALQADTKRFLNINLSLKQIAQFLAEDKKGIAKWLAEDFKEGPATAKTWKYGVDTMPRDYWFDLLGYRFAGSHWPLNGDGEGVSEAFFKKFYKNLAKNNIKFKNIYN